MKNPKNSKSGDFLNLIYSQKKRAEGAKFLTFRFKGRICWSVGLGGKSGSPPDRHQNYLGDMLYDATDGSGTCSEHVLSKGRIWSLIFAFCGDKALLRIFTFHSFRGGVPGGVPGWRGPNTGRTGSKFVTILRFSGLNNKITVRYPNIGRLFSRSFWPFGSKRRPFLHCIYEFS